VHLWPESDVAHLLGGLRIAAQIDEGADIEDEVVASNRLDPPTDSVVALEHHGRTARLLNAARRGEPSDACTDNGRSRFRCHRHTVRTI